MEAMFTAATTVALAGVLFLQQPAFYPSEYLYGRFTNGTAFTWREAAILDSPDPGADTVLVAGRRSIVFIGGEPSGVFTWRGILTEYYPVASGLDRGIEGYLPGTDLAMAVIDLVEGPLLMCVLTGSPAGGQDSFTAAVLAFDREGGLLDSIQAVVPGSSGSGSSVSYDYVIGFSGAPVECFDGLEQGVFLSAIYEACGRPWTSHLIAWDGERLVSGPSTVSVSESGCCRHLEDLLMPGEPGSRPGRILLTVRDDVWVDSLEQSVVTGCDTTVFIWTGAEFVEEPADRRQP